MVALLYRINISRLIGVDVVGKKIKISIIGKIKANNYNEVTLYLIVDIDLSKYSLRVLRLILY